MLLGNERHPDFEYPDDEWVYYLFAKEFGWPPSVTDEQPAYLIDWLLGIHQVSNEAEVERSGRKT